MEANIEEIKIILSTPIALRSQKMIQVLMDLTKSITFFKNLIEELGEKMHYRICEFISLKFKEADSILFNQGDVGDNFYILLEGKVKLLTWVEGEEGEEQTEIAQLGPGQSFGELSLIKNRPRNASVICMQKCYFMMLSKDNYLRLLGKSVLKMLEDKIEFLHSLQMFSNWSKRSIEKISFAFEVRSFKQNDIIYQEGDYSLGAYLVLKGEVELTVTNKVEKNLPRKLKVALIGEKDFFGDEELLIEAPRKYTARCSSKLLSTYFILKSDFFGKITSESLACLTRANAIRNNIRETRLNSVKKYQKIEINSATPDKKKKKVNLFAFKPKKRPSSKSASRNLCLSEVLMRSIKKRSLFHINSPTASILISHSIVKRPRSVNTFYITKGFQPKNGLPSGIFQRIQNRIRDL